MQISNNIKELIQITEDLQAMSDAISPHFGSAAKVAKKVASAAQETDTAKNTKKILDNLPSAADRDQKIEAIAKKAKSHISSMTGHKSPNTNDMLDKAKSSIAKNAGKVKGVWATDDKGHVKGTSMSEDEYHKHILKRRGIKAPETTSSAPMKPVSAGPRAFVPDDKDKILTAGRTVSKSDLSTHTTPSKAPVTAAASAAKPTEAASAGESVRNLLNKANQARENIGHAIGGKVYDMTHSETANKISSGIAKAREADHAASLLRRKASGGA